MPEPPASSCPDQLSVNEPGSVAGRACTLLVGAAESMVSNAAFVSTGAFSSNTTDAVALIALGVTRVDFGRIVYVTNPSPIGALLSGGRKPASASVTGASVAGSSEVKVQVTRPVVGSR